MWKYIFIALLGSALQMAYAQDSTHAFFQVGDGLNENLKVLFEDTLHQYIWAGGNFDNDPFNPYPAGCVYYDGTAWQGLDSTLTGEATAFAVYQGKTYIGGYLGLRTDPRPSIRFLMTWEAGELQSVLPLTSGSGRLKSMIIDSGYLYVMGTFPVFDTLPRGNVLRYDGSRWEMLPPLDTTGSFTINVGLFYQGQLYAGGNFLGQSAPFMADIARFDGQQWQPVGQGLSGPQTWVNDMLIYDSLLVMGGRFRKRFGDPGNGVLAWDGRQWIELGDGLYHGQVWGLEVYEEQLYAFGVFSLDPNPAAPLYFMARWDGEEWEIFTEVNSFGLVGALSTADGLYFGGSPMTIRGEDFPEIARYAPVENQTTHVPSPARTGFTVSPNPARDRLLLHNPQGVYLDQVTWHDLTGRQVQTQRLGTDAPEVKLDVSGLSPGIYWLRIGEEGVKVMVE